MGPKSCAASSAPRQIVKMEPLLRFRLVDFGRRPIKRRRDLGIWVMDSNPPALSLAGQAQSPRAPGRPLPVSFWVGGCIAAACVAIATLTIVLPEGSIAAEFLLDHGPHSLFAPIYPLTIQNLLHVL